MGYNPETGIYSLDNDILVNSREFTRTAQYFKKHGVYTKAHPIYDKVEYDEFWNEEEKRRREGFSVGGVRITGEHYGFLNFAQILRTSDPEQGGVFKSKKVNDIVRKKLDFPDIWDGHKEWFRAKEVARRWQLHLLGGKSRRKGFSYVGGWEAFNSYDLNPGLSIAIGAFDKKYLTKGNATMSMAKKYADFINLHTDWKKKRIINTTEHIKSGFTNEGEDEIRGFQSEILAISFKDNPDAIAGKDLYEVYLEEWGVFPNIEEVLGILLPTLEDGNVLTGQLIGWGTGGSKDANWEAFENIFYNPGKHRFMAFENIWDDAASNTVCGFFFPYVQNLVTVSPDPKCIDENGNSNLVEAKKISDRERLRKKNSTNSVTDYNLYVGQRANKPSEAFSRSVANIFTSKELSDHIHKVKNDPDIKYLARCGKMIRTEKGVKFITNGELDAQGFQIHDPVNHYPHASKEDVTGCYVEWQPPYRDGTGKTPHGLYRIWNDPYAHDKEKEHISLRDSLGATYIYERVNNVTSTRGDILIGAYIGRPEKQDDYNEQLLRISEYISGEPEMLMFENERGDVKRYFESKKKGYLLANEPEITWKKELQSAATGRNKGILINPIRRGTGAVYYKDWLYTVRGVDKDGNTKMNLHYIYDLGLLQETEKWNLKGNFDRVSCMIVGMFDMKEEFEREITPAEDDDLEEFFNRRMF